MSRGWGRGLAAAALLCAAGAAWIARDHRSALLRLHGWLTPAAGLEAAPALDPGVAWHDDYYTLERLDEGTWAIGEPRFAEKNFDYLILGATRGVLFDAGPGLRQLAPVVAALTDLPVTFVPSHLHYDHVGGARGFERVAMIDLPALRSQAPRGTLVPTFAQHLGAVAGLEAPALEVDEWWAPGARIDLGGRALEVWHVPGHTPESAALHDPERGWVFAGDYLYPGELYAFLPGSSLADYLWSAERLLRGLGPGSVFFGAHGLEATAAPALALRDVADLRDALREIRAGERQGEGLFPRRYPVSERLTLAADGIAGDWTPRASPAPGR